MLRRVMEPLCLRVLTNHWQAAITDCFFANPATPQFESSQECTPESSSPPISAGINCPKDKSHQLQCDRLHSFPALLAASSSTDDLSTWCVYTEQANKGTHKTALNDTTSAVATCGQIDIIKLSRDPSQYLHHMQSTPTNLPADAVVSYLVRSEGGQKSYCRWCGGHVRNFRRRFPFPRSVAQGARAALTCQCALYPPPLAQD